MSRQRAFLRLINDRPELALHVRSFAWTLIWLDHGEENLTDIDLELWNVFGRLTLVHDLDLSSAPSPDLSVVTDPIIRNNPAQLFPAVTHLRLRGWMHRGLADAIVGSIDTAALRTLILHDLQDEGAFSNGKPMCSKSAGTYASTPLFGAGVKRTIISEGIYKRHWL